MNLPTIDWAHDWASYGTWALAAALVLGAIAWYTTQAARRLATAATGRAPVILAAIVALLASGMSIQAQWAFLEHNLGITNTWSRAAFVGVFDLAAIAAALLSREARIARPGTFGADGTIVWGVALLLGYLGSTEATTTEGRIARWAVPLVAALMWDRVIQRDVQRAVGIDRARMATVTGRIVTTIARVATGCGRAVVRTLARLGLVQPDQDIAQIQHARWQRRFISAAGRARQAIRRLESDPESATAQRSRDRSYAQFERVVASGQRIGAIATPGDLERLLWSARVALTAADALAQTTAESPWQVAGRPTDEPTDDRSTVTDRPKAPIDQTGDRPTGREPIDQTDHPIERPTGHGPTDTPIERPTKKPTDRPDEPRPITSSDDQPTEPTGRTITPIDRPTTPATDRTKRRSKEENEYLIRLALEDIITDAASDTIGFPSHGAIAAKATDLAKEHDGDVRKLHKSTVSGFLGRTGLSGITTLTRDIVDSLTAKTI